MDSNEIGCIETIQSQKSGLSTRVDQELLRELFDAELMMIGGGSGEVVLG